MLKRFFIAIFLLLPLLFPQEFYAQTSWRTKIGDPAVNSVLLSAGVDIMAAYGKCGQPAYATYNSAALSGCLEAELRAKGYDSTNLSAFISERPSSVAGGCTQCLGFVRIVAALAHGSGAGLTQFDASETSRLGSFTTGSATYTRLGQNEPIRPGDIAARASDRGGHILIIKEVLGDKKFVALESNVTPCTITDTNQGMASEYNIFRANI